MPAGGPAFCSSQHRGSRTKTEFIGFAGSRARTESPPGPAFCSSQPPGFAHENRIHWLCGQPSANRAGTRASFFHNFRPRVRAQKPISLALRAAEREPNRRPGRLSALLSTGVRAQKLNLLALRETEREPNRRPCRLFLFFRSGLGAQTPAKPCSFVPFAPSLRAFSALGRYSVESFRPAP